MHTYIPSLLDLPPAPILIKVITEHCAEPPELYRRFPLAAYFTNGSVYVCAYVSILLSQFVPPSLLPHVHTSVLYIHICLPALQIGSSVPFSWIPLKTELPYGLAITLLGIYTLRQP